MRALRFIFHAAIVVSIMALFFIYNDLEERFKGHWHFFPKPIHITVDEPDIFSKVPYQLTPTLPKKIRKNRQPACIFWSYSYCWPR